MAELVAWVDDQEVGRFSEHHVPDGSSFTFEYVEGASAEDLVSLTMIPLPHQRRFDSRAFPPAFDMILPEGERRLRIEAARKIVSTLPYIPEDVPALALSFDWYSKAWWPRTKIEEFPRTHGKLSPADTARLFEESLAAVAEGLKLTQKLGKQIRGFAELAATLTRLWTSRVATFRAN